MKLESCLLCMCMSSKSLGQYGVQNSKGYWLSSSGKWHRVALIRTDVSEDRIASIFRVPLHEASFSPLPLPLPLWLSYHTQLNTTLNIPLYSTLIPHSSNLGLSTSSRLGLVSYEPVPIQELTTSLCNQLALVHPKMEAIRSSETSVLIRATRCHFPEDDNHHTHRRENIKSYIAKVAFRNYLCFFRKL
jgi:hypothetical protein